MVLLTMNSSGGQRYSLRKFQEAAKGPALRAPGILAHESVVAIVERYLSDYLDSLYNAE